MAPVEIFYPNEKIRIVDPATLQPVTAESNGVVITPETKDYYIRMERSGAGVIREQLSELSKPAEAEESSKKEDKSEKPKLTPDKNVK